MSHVSTYLTFDGTAEQALAHYVRVFGSSPDGPVMRMGDMEAGPGAPELAPDELRRVMHARMTIAGGHVLMFSDTVPSMGHQHVVGTNVALSVEADSREEADRLYAGLSEGGTEVSGMQDMFWGYWGSCLDRFGIRWMVNVTNPEH